MFVLQRTRKINVHHCLNFVREVALGCAWCLDQNNHQGWYGGWFVRALAGAAGLQCSKLEPDCSGVDFDISSPQEIDGDFPCVKVQVKTWSTPKEADGAWRYAGLTQKRFNALAGPRRIPRFLFLVIVPADVSLYSATDEHGLRLSHAAYWMSLKDLKPFGGAACDRKVPLLVPKDNLLTVHSLRTICEDPGVAGRRAS